jgi:hypothetical protein
MSVGWLFVLLLAALVAGYLIIGSTCEYWRERRLRLPHAAFWAALWVLVVDGLGLVRQAGGTHTPQPRRKRSTHAHTHTQHTHPQPQGARTKSGGKRSSRHHRHHTRRRGSDPIHQSRSTASSGRGGDGHDHGQRRRASDAAATGPSADSRQQRNDEHTLPRRHDQDEGIKLKTGLPSGGTAVQGAALPPLAPKIRGTTAVSATLPPPSSLTEPLVGGAITGGYAGGRTEALQLLAPSAQEVSGAADLTPRTRRVSRFAQRGGAGAPVAVLPQAPR